jgi:thiamine-monophosphate kinase
MEAMGEFDLLARMRERLPSSGGRLLLGSGDDAAVTSPTGVEAISIDALVDGVHFRRAHAAPRQIGRKALSVALSDLAAMGAEPGEAYVALTVPQDLDEGACLELLDGLLEVASETGAALAGGDLTRSPVLSLAVTVVGHAPERASLISRSGAREGDVLAVTGELGGAAAGLLTLEDRRTAAAVPEGVLAALRARQLDPSPRLAAGRALAAHGARAMIDLSDGLGGDATRLAERSAVGMQIDAALLPLAAGLAEAATAAAGDPLELAVSGGEDYELLAALPAERFEEAAGAVQDTGVELTRVGEAGGEGVRIRRPGGAPLEPRGYDQLG